MPKSPLWRNPQPMAAPCRAKLSLRRYANKMDRTVLLRDVAVGVVRQKGCGGNAYDCAEKNVERDRIARSGRSEHAVAISGAGPPAMTDDR